MKFTEEDENRQKREIVKGTLHNLILHLLATDFSHVRTL